jgi:D-amino-acid dehydrogenase
MSDVAVIGAGIVGISTAYALVKAGHKVTVYDSESYPAMKTSYANGGQISVSNSEVWNSWGNIRKAITWLGKKDAPLLLRPSLDMDQLAWLTKFLWTTVKNEGQRNTIATIQMGLEARALYQKIIEEENIQFDRSNCGIMHIYKDAKYFGHAWDMQRVYEDNGCSWTILSPDQVFNIEPNLYNHGDIVGGTWTPEDWTGDIHKYCFELYKILKVKYNVSFVFDYKVVSIDETMMLGQHEKVVIANGVGATELTKSIGDKQLVYPVKGYSITITVNDSQVKYLPEVSLLDDQAKIVTSTLGNRLRVAGTAELAGHNYDIVRDRIDPLLTWVNVNFPSLDTREYTQWACLRPMTPNMLPIVKQSKTNNKVYYHFGHGHLGWTLSPATAEQLVKLMEE